MTNRGLRSDQSLTRKGGVKMVRRIRQMLLIAAPLLALAALAGALLGGGMEFASAHGLVVHAAASIQPDGVSNPVPFWG